MAALFEPLTMRGVTMRNRIVVSPMCQYSSEDGFANDWHLVHLGSRAVGGAGVVMVEASAVEPAGRISPQDMGLWKEDHIEPLRRIAEFVKSNGAVPAIQLAHAGRKGSTRRPWDGGASLPVHEGGWETIAPSAIPFAPQGAAPRAMKPADILSVIDCFARSAALGCRAGFELIEIHAAHGYLLHEFLSPLSNKRNDDYGGSFENRTRLVREVVSRVRAEMPPEMPLWIRLSATDWAENGWTADDTVRLAAVLRELGVDLVDCSSGGLVPDAKIPIAPGYQTPFAARVRNESGVLSGAVGLITGPHQAEEIISSGSADVVLLAREMLRDPYWPLHAAKALGVDVRPPNQYLRAFL